MSEWDSQESRTQFISVLTRSWESVASRIHRTSVRPGGQAGNGVMHRLKPSQVENLAMEAALLMCFQGETLQYISSPKQGIAEVFKRQRFFRLLPRFAEKQKKSDSQSELLRASGNQAFKKREFTEALRIYTGAICCAETGGEAISMAYANRSAVNYELEAYNDSIRDVNHALNTGKYPDHLMQKLYDRRGKCYTALSQYKKAAEDFKQVITLLLKSDLTKEKTLNIKSYIELIAECIGKDDAHQPQTAEPKLSSEPSRRIKCASSAIDLRYSTKMGRHVVATKNISPGEILAVESPFVSVLFLEYQHFFCDNCMTRCLSSIPCTRCNNVVFCSENCQQKSWESHHSIECDLLPSLMNLDSCPSELMAIRALLKATKCGKDLERFVKEYDDPKNTKRDKVKAHGKTGYVDVSQSDDYRSIHDLVTHEKERSPDIRLKLTAMASIIVHVLRGCTTFFNGTDTFHTSSGASSQDSLFQNNHAVAGNLIMRYLMIASCNAYAIEETNFTAREEFLEYTPRIIGGAIYPFFSLINHSCDPNGALYTHRGDIPVLYALKPIEKGQQIFVSYGTHYAEDELLLRQIHLSFTYFFTCECPACLNNWPLIIDMPVPPTFVSDRARKTQGQKVDDWLSKLFPILEASKKGPITEEQFQTLVHHLQLFHKYIKLPWAPHFLAQRAIRRQFLFKGAHNINADFVPDHDHHDLLTTFTRSTDGIFKHLRRQ